MLRCVCKKGELDASDHRGWRMLAWRIGVILGWSVFLIAFGTQPSLAVTPYDDVLVQQAVKNLQQENYDEALGQLTEAWQKGAHTPEKAFLFGQVYRLMLNYPKAKDYLQEALRLKRDFRPAQLMLADTYLAMDQPKEAGPILQDLAASGYEPGQTAYLMGVAASKEGRYSEALDYFRKAEADPKVAQEAKFQASLALAALNRVKEAKTAMQESIALNPRSQTADFAQRYMGVLSQRTQAQSPFHISVSSAFDYDSNVTLAPGAGANGRRGFREGQRGVFPDRPDGVHGPAERSLQRFDPILLFSEFSSGGAGVRHYEPLLRPDPHLWL